MTNEQQAAAAKLLTGLASALAIVRKALVETEQALESLSTALSQGTANEQAEQADDIDEGWARPANARKWHYYVGDQSLCGKWSYLGDDLVDGFDDSETNCKACQAKVAKRRETRKVGRRIRELSSDQWFTLSINDTKQYKTTARIDEDSQTRLCLTDKGQVYRPSLDAIVYPLADTVGSIRLYDLEKTEDSWFRLPGGSDRYQLTSDEKSANGRLYYQVQAIETGTLSWMEAKTPVIRLIKENVKTEWPPEKTPKSGRLRFLKNGSIFRLKCSDTEYEVLTTALERSESLQIKCMSDKGQVTWLDADTQVIPIIKASGPAA